MPIKMVAASTAGKQPADSGSTDAGRGSLGKSIFGSVDDSAGSANLVTVPKQNLLLAERRERAVDLVSEVRSNV